MAMDRRIYVSEAVLPPRDDPEVEARVAGWRAEVRPQQRPGRALAAALLSLAIGVVLWGAVNRATGFAMPWLLTALSAVVLGVLLGLPYKRAGRLVDARWAWLAAGLGVVMAVLGDLGAQLLLHADREGLGAWEVISSLDGATFVTLIAARAPLDWVVSGLAGAGAAFSARPLMGEPEVRQQARIDVYAERLAEKEARADERARRRAEDDEEE
jgi:hypothetical protein